MAKVFETQFEKGSYIERFSGLAATLINIPSFSKRNKGLCLSLDGVDQFIHYGNLDAGNRGISDFSIEVSFLSKAKTPYPIQRLMGKDTNSTGWRVYLSDITGNLRFALGEGSLSHKSFSGAYSLIDGLDHHIIITIDRSGNAVAYDNGSIYGTTSISAEVADNLDNADDLEVGATVGGFPLNGFIHKAVIYDHLLTTQERAQAYNKFLQAHPQEIEKYPRYNPHSKPTDLSNEPGLEAAFNMIPNGTHLVDLAGNNHFGTTENAPASTLNGLKFSASRQQRVTVNGFSTFPPPVTYCFRLKYPPVAGNNAIIGGGGGLGYEMMGVVFQAANTIYAGIYNQISGWYALAKATSQIGLKQWNNFVVTSDGITTKIYRNGIDITEASVTDPLSIVGFRLMSNGLTGYTEGELADVRVYNSVLTEQQAKDYHNSFAKRILLIEDFGLDPVGSILPRGWIPGTGMYEIKELSTQDSVLKHLDVGIKYLECTTAGTISIPSKAVDGTWECDVYKGGDANVPVIFYTTDANGATGINRHSIRLMNDESLQLLRSSTILLSSAASYISFHAWYRLKVTCAKNGKTYFYVKGGLFGFDDWVLVSVSGGSGTNPVTSTARPNPVLFTLDFDAGDRIANIKITEGVEQ